MPLFLLMSDKLSYKKAGVDIEEGEKFVKAISPLAKRTFRPEVLTGLGSFGSMFRLDTGKYREPVLVSGTDGVGTKLNIAFMADVHDTVGIDLVAMCVNDVLTCGAEPLFFLDYFATGKLEKVTAIKVVEGIANGCQEAGCSLVGGETAEMPGFYADGEYDISGFCVGVVEHSGIVDGSRIKEGDAIIGLHSNGLHSNGYSLVRKVLFEVRKMEINEYLPDIKSTISEELLKPTKIYAKAVEIITKHVDVKGMAHITGGGIPGNLSRILPDGLHAELKHGSWPVQPIFGLLKRWGDVSDTDMQSTFNMGIGYISIVNASDAEKTLDILDENGYYSSILGTIKTGSKGVSYV
jgi:phosphoribosylformylglycinamidine cyclo-ligase